MKWYTNENGIAQIWCYHFHSSFCRTYFGFALTNKWYGEKVCKWTGMYTFVLFINANLYVKKKEKSVRLYQLSAADSHSDTSHTKDSTDLILIMISWVLLSIFALMLCGPRIVPMHCMNRYVNHLIYICWMTIFIFFFFSVKTLNKYYLFCQIKSWKFKLLSCWHYPILNPYMDPYRDHKYQSEIKKKKFFQLINLYSLCIFCKQFPP